jgi:hypothetical protein
MPKTILLPKALTVARHNVCRTLNKAESVLFLFRFRMANLYIMKKSAKSLMFVRAQSRLNTNCIEPHWLDGKQQNTCPPSKSLVIR